MSEFGSADITLTLPTFETDEWVGVKLDAFDSSQDGDGQLSVRVAEDLIQLVSEPSGTVLGAVSFDAYTPTPAAMFDTDFLPLFEIEPDYTPQSVDYLSSGETLRISFQNEGVTIYRNGNYLHGFFVPDISYPEDEPTITVLCSADWVSNPTVGISVTELDDWREAIYLETESVASSGISALIQDRPVIVLGKGDGSIQFFYEVESDPIEVNGDIVKSHSEIEREAQASADALIESREVSAISYPDYADEIGYAFRVMRLGSLDSGEKRVARVLLERGMESAVGHMLQLRPDLRLEPYDIIQIDYVTTGTQTSISRTIVIENVSIRLEFEHGSMELTGRQSL